MTIRIQNTSAPHVLVNHPIHVRGWLKKDSSIGVPVGAEIEIWGSKRVKDAVKETWERLDIAITYTIQHRPLGYEVRTDGFYERGPYGCPDLKVASFVRKTFVSTASVLPALKK